MKKLSLKKNLLSAVPVVLLALTLGVVTACSSTEEESSDPDDVEEEIQDLPV